MAKLIPAFCLLFTVPACQIHNYHHYKYEYKYDVKMDDSPTHKANPTQ